MKNTYLFLTILFILGFSNLATSKISSKEGNISSTVDKLDSLTVEKGAKEFLVKFLELSKNSEISNDSYKTYFKTKYLKKSNRIYIQKIEDYRITETKYPFFYVLVKPKSYAYEIDSDWTVLLTFKLMAENSNFSIIPSIVNKVARCYWESKDVKENQNDRVDYSKKWFSENYNLSVPNKDILSDIKSQDISHIWMKTLNKTTNGVFGKNYRRIEFVFENVSKVKNNDEYIVNGKDRMKGKICSFTGNLNVTHAIKYDERDIDLSIIILGEYELIEIANTLETGKFMGIFCTYCYYDTVNQRLELDDRWSVADGYMNNTFVGIWRDLKNGYDYKCIWGDHRLPYTGDFDVGTGEFAPNDKYLKYGWENYTKAYLGGDKKALEIENIKWWK